MKSKFILVFLLINIISSAYDRNKAVSYAYKFYNKINHDCSRSRSSFTHMDINAIILVDISWGW